MKPLASDLETELHSKILSAINGDPLAYEDFLHQTASLLRSYLMKLMKSSVRCKEKAEDLVQDILLSIHQKRHLYRTSEPILPWVYSIARYRYIDSLRAEARRPQYSEWVDNYDDFLSTTEPVPDFPLNEKIEKMLAVLPQNQQTILKMAKMDEIPLAEISEKMQTSLASVKISVHRALKKLRVTEKDKQDLSL